MNQTPKWEQKIFFPIIDHFFTITIQVILIKSVGWIKENKEEEVYGEVIIPVVDVLGGVADNKFFKWPLKLMPKY